MFSKRTEQKEHILLELELDPFITVPRRATLHWPFERQGGSILFWGTLHILFPANQCPAEPPHPVLLGDQHRCSPLEHYLSVVFCTVSLLVDIIPSSMYLSRFTSIFEQRGTHIPALISFQMLFHLCEHHHNCTKFVHI